MIKHGAMYRDCWLRVWQVICYDDTSGKWLVRLAGYPYQTYFSAEKILNEWELISP